MTADSSDWLPRWLPLDSRTPARCHLFGAASSIALMIGIAWVASHNRTPVTTVKHGDTLIDLNEAFALIENADQWRELYTDNFSQSQSVESRAKQISNWLPVSADWAEADPQIRRLGDEAGVRILDLNPGLQYVGTRVGVLAATCNVEGSFESLCRFLGAFSELDHPIGCSEIELRRIREPSRLSAGGDSPLRATLSLRIPFAAPTSASGLLLAETNHDS